MAKKVFSIIAVVVLFPLTFAVLFGITTKLTILNKEFVKKELAGQKVYEKVYTNFPEFVSTMAEKEGGEGSLAGNPLFKESIVLIAQKVLSPNELRVITEAVIDGAWPWLFEGRDELSFNQSVASLKEKSKNEILNFFKEKYNSIRYCKYGEQFAGDVMSANACRPVGISFEQISAQFGADKIISEDVLSVVPDNISPETLAEENQGFAETLSSAKKTKPFFDLSGLLIYIVPVLLLGVLVLLGRFAGGSWEKMPKMLGLYFVILGGLSFLAGKVIFGSLLPQTFNFGMEQFQEAPKIKSEIVSPLLNDILAKMSEQLNLLIIYIVSFGAVLMIGFWVLDKFLDHRVKKPGWSLPKKNPEI